MKGTPILFLAVVASVLASALGAGARLAAPGEFTQPSGLVKMLPVFGGAIGGAVAGAIMASSAGSGGSGSPMSCCIPTVSSSRSAGARPG